MFGYSFHMLIFDFPLISSFLPFPSQALGLACEKAEPDVMQRPPVEKGKLLVNRVLFADTLWYGFVMGVLG